MTVSHWLKKLIPKGFLLESPPVCPMNASLHLECSNLSAGYINRKVIHDLAVSVTYPGLVSLIGPNGSGKTTLLKTLAGLVKYTGSITFNYQELSTYSNKRLAQYIGFSMSAKNFHPSSNFSVYEVIAMGRLPHLGLFSTLSGYDKDIILSAAERLCISGILHQNILTLSDGQRQLALLAAVLAQDTPVMLLDEPTSSLDPDKSAMVFSLLHSLAKTGRVIIAAVHDINASMHYSDEYIALRNGVLISHGHKLSAETLNELYGCEFADYLNEEGNDVMWRALPK